MKNKIFIAGLCTSVAFASCTNEDLLGLENNNNSLKSDFTLVFDGMNVPSSRMVYDEGSFLWQANDGGVSDQIGVCRTIDGINVVSNSMFTATKVSNDNTTDPATWGAGSGKYAYFETDIESIFEGNYVVTYPWNPEMTKDGKITATLQTTQKAENSEEGGGNDNYVANYGFMMSEVTSFSGGQTTGHFSLYPVLSRLKFNVTANGTAAGAKLQSIVLRTADGSKSIPTELEIPANVKQAADGYLDFSMMSVKEDSKVSQVVLTMNGGTALETEKAQEYYMTLLPGSYSNVVIDFITDKGISTYKTTGTPTLSSGRFATIEYDVNSTEACSKFFVATETDWNNAVANINKSVTNGTAAEIVVLDNVTISQNELRGLSDGQGNHDITINGAGKLIVNDSKSVNVAIKDVVFNVPVEFTAEFKDYAGDNVVFNKGITAKAGLHLASGSTYVVNGGTVGGSNIFLGRGVTTLNNVTFTGKVQTCNVNGTTQKLTFNNCKFESEVTEYSNDASSIFTINSCSFDDNKSETNNAALTLSKGSIVTFTGESKAENINVNNGSAKVIVNGNLTISNSLTTNAGTVEVNKDAVLTLDNKVKYDYNKIVKVEGKLVNKGIITISSPVIDIDTSNGYKGEFDNQGLVYVPKDKVAYESQRITYYNNGDMYVTGVSDKDSFNNAIKNKDVTGVQLANSSFDFSTLSSKDYSAYDVEIQNEIIVPDGLKLANVFVKGSNASIKGKVKNAAINVADLDVIGNLTINNSESAVTINAVNVTVESGAKLTNAAQVSYTGTFSSQGTVVGQPIKK